MKLKDIVTNTLKDTVITMDTFYHYEAIFLDRFKNNPRLELIQEEPDESPMVPKAIYVRLAAVAETLARQYDMPIPDWVFNTEKYKFPADEPWFSFNAEGDLRIALIMLSPPEFKWRNMFVMDNTLSRC